MSNSLLAVYRCYEASWINTLNQPQIGLLEIYVNDNKPIDTFWLKSFLDEIRFNTFKTKTNYLDACKAVITNQYFDAHVVLTPHSQFSDIHLAPPFSYNHAIDTVRFICPDTQQPMHGMLWYSSNSVIPASNLLEWVVASRNEKITANTFVTSLFDQITDYSDQNAQVMVSLHLSRKGGISQQWIQTSHHFIPLGFVFRATCE